MKKLLAVIMCLAVLLSLCSVMANAIVRVGKNGDGIIKIEWDDEAVDKITFDGDISEWEDNGYSYTVIDRSNMYAWSGSIDSDFAISAYFVADSDWLYVAYRVFDSDWVKCTDDKTIINRCYSNADAFQLAVDFGTFMETALKTDCADYGNNKSIFYSFACHEEGEPLVFARQESYNDAVLSEANGDGVKGAAGEYEGGWCVEYAIAWDQMYEDFLIKTLETHYRFPFNADNDLQLGILLCYLNHSDDDGEVKRTWMAGTTKGNHCNWDPMDSGIYLTLEWEEGRRINITGIDNGKVDTTETETETAQEVTTPTVTPPDNLPDRSEWDFYMEKLYFDADVNTPDDGTYEHVAQKLFPGQSVATKFTVTKGALSGIQINCPSWNDNFGTLTLEIYEWIDGEGTTERKTLSDGYAKTISSQPIDSQTFVHFIDNETLTIYLDHYELPWGGTYLAVLSNPDEEDFSVGYFKSNLDLRSYYSERDEDTKFTLPTDADIKAAGYDPQFSTNVISFNTKGIPQYGSFANFKCEVMCPDENWTPPETDTCDTEEPTTTREIYETETEINMGVSTDADTDTTVSQESQTTAVENKDNNTESAIVGDKDDETKTETAKRTDTAADVLAPTITLVGCNSSVAGVSALISLLSLAATVVIKKNKE